jgi:hypothetical protein
MDDLWHITAQIPITLYSILVAPYPTENKYMEILKNSYRHGDSSPNNVLTGNINIGLKKRPLPEVYAGTEY